MQETELHDLSDDAASLRQESASMMRSDTDSKRSTFTEPDGAEVVYKKGNVTIHPSHFASERISGRLKLIKQGSSIFMKWIPYKEWSSNAMLSEKGLAFPPLYFYNGGVREFLAKVKQHVFLVRSGEDANVFFVNDFQNRLQRNLSSLELPRAVAVASGSSTFSVDESPSNENRERNDGDVLDERLSISQYNGRQKQMVHDPARDL